MDQALCIKSVGEFLKKYAFVKVLFRICRVGIGKLCIFKRSPGDFEAPPNLEISGLYDLHDTFFRSKVL